MDASRPRDDCAPRVEATRATHPVVFQEIVLRLHSLHRGLSFDPDPAVVLPGTPGSAFRFTVLVDNPVIYLLEGTLAISTRE